MQTALCLGCGARFPDIEGPTHRYMASSPGCWAAFGEVLAREYSDPTLFEIHRLTVDAYAAQHPGTPSPPAAQSVGVHLIRLYLLLECGLEMQRANDAMLFINARKSDFIWLTPPREMGHITVAEVQGAATATQHKQRVREWAASVWQAWSPHHETIRRWAPAVDEIASAPRKT